MEKMTLLRSQRNNVFEILSEVGLEPSEFEWREERLEPIPIAADEGIVSKLVHRTTGYGFLFDVRDDLLWGTFSPARESPQAHESAESWTEMLHMVHDWANALKDEVETPDLWSAIGQERRIFSAVAEATDSEPFTEREQEDIKAGLGKLRIYLLEQVKDDEDNERLVNEKLDYLVSATKRSSRMDWLHMALGVLATITVGIGFAPEGAKELFQYAGDVILRGIQSLK